MEQKRICVNKFSVEPPSQYSYSEMGSKIFHRCFEVDDVGIRPRQTHPGLPEGKNFYTHTPARALRWEGRPVRPWREAHSLSPCPDGQRLRYGPGSRTLSPACSTPRATTPDVIPPTPPGPALPAPGESMYTRTKYQARPEAQSALQGRGTGLARWWGHEVLKGPNTLTVVWKLST